MAIRVSRQVAEALVEEDPNLRVSRQVAEALVEEAPNLRVSRQVAEALVAEDPNLRVSRQTVEALVPVPSATIHNESATSTLSLSQEASPGVIPAVASSALSLSQTASVSWIRQFAAESTLAIGHVCGYVGPKWVSGSSSILVDQSAHLAEVHEVTAESAVLFDQSTAVRGTIRVSAENTIALSQFADHQTKARAVETTIVLSQSAGVDKVLVARSQITLAQKAEFGAIPVAAESVLDLQQSARYAPFPQSAESQIKLSQSAWCNLRHVSAENTLYLTQSNIVQKPIRVSAQTELTTTDLVWNGLAMVETQTGLRQSASTLTTGSEGPTTYVSFSHQAGVVHVRASGTGVSATSAISLSQEARLSETGDAESQINLTQSAFGAAGKPIGNQLDLIQSAEVTVIRAQPAESTIQISQAATYTLILASTRGQYSPFVGSTTDPDAPTPPSTSLQGPMAGIQVPFQLVYPATGAVTDTVSLKTPNLGNKDRLAFNRVLRETRGGTLIVYADPIWPKVQTLVLSFSGLLRVEAQELLTFLEVHLGREIGLIDWEHRYWRGVIITPDEPIVEDKFDSFTASFEFEGELDPTWNPQVVPPSLRFSPTRSPQLNGHYVPVEPMLPVMSEMLDYHEAEAASIIKVGYPLYLTTGGLVEPAKADASATVQVVGIAMAATTPGDDCPYITEGRVERTDWTEVAGTPLLSTGASYFLDPFVAGRITTTAPTTSGHYVVRVGRAVSSKTLDVEIELPILL